MRMTYLFCGFLLGAVTVSAAKSLAVVIPAIIGLAVVAGYILRKRKRNV